MNLATVWASLVLALALSASAGGIVPTTPGHVQEVKLTILAGDRVIEPNVALAPAVPVRLTVTNETHEFHTFTVPSLHLSELILPDRTTTLLFTPDRAGAYRWHCVICPSGQHGHPHTMGGTLYLIVNPSALP